MTRYYNLHDFFHEQASPRRLCDQAGCSQHGEYRAPISPSKLYDYHWFCLDHVREYNSNWDYYKQLSEQDIERLYREDVTWQRPTWKFGFDKTSYHKFNTFYREDFLNAKQADQTQKGSSDAILDRKHVNALKLLGLDESADIVEIKTRYKQLAKKYHPDLNQNCAHSQEMLKEINQAYHILKKRHQAAS